VSIFRLKRLVQFFLFSIVIVGCAVVAERELDQRWGVETIQDRTRTEIPQGTPEYHRDIQPIFDKRCVTCHACYDGPCQLKLTEYDGLDRGASKELVYDGTRLLASEPSRLGVDAKSTQAWRQKGYFPVLNERAQTPEANLYGSLLYRMLAQKRANPLLVQDGVDHEDPLSPVEALDEDDFDFSTSRDQECPTISEYASYVDDHPQWGMPYGLPAISDGDFDMIKRWIEAGSPVQPLPPLAAAYQDQIAKWEAFFNGQSNKARLFARYAYEHLFLANLWFEALGNSQFFKLVRSRTPSGEAIDEIASRRPFDAPGVDHFYYRLKPVRSTIVDKTHMPYALNDQRMQNWSEWFLEPEYTVQTLPSYAPERASNPFVTFKDLPTKARYKFMLEEAEFTIMGYIKGPVCRGQVALNVIEDHFWVFFIDPDIPTMLYDPAVVERAAKHLRLPAAEQSNASPLSVWIKYADLQEAHLQDKSRYIQSKSKLGAGLSLNLLWDGDQQNTNAALTIFRHFDNATVVKGMHGPKPKTAWVISYSLLERIHYLLVAGFDVYGNVGHQLNTRLYMDFLRMEGESNFLMLLPKQDAQREMLSWYDGAEDKVESYLGVLHDGAIPLNDIRYQSNDPKNELFDMIASYLGGGLAPTQPILPVHFTDKAAGLDENIDRLKTLSGIAAEQFPELSMVRVKRSDGQQQVFTIAVNRYHQNVSSLFMEEDRLVPENYTATLYPGVLGSYPNVFFDVHELLFEHFVDRALAIEEDDDYIALVDDFGVRRSDKNFWSYADWLHIWYLVNQPGKAGIIDLNRYENR